MRYKKFIIEDYRAVEYAEVPVGNNLIPLVGINESGKTSILQAILAFDRLSDSYGGGKHLEFKNKYRIGTHDCKITAEVIIDSEADLDMLSAKLRLSRGNELLQELEMMHSLSKSFMVHRDLSTGEYSVSGISVPVDQQGRLARVLYSILPFLLYFDDFTERVPESVRYITTDTEKGYRLRQSRLGEWNRILEEVFVRATEGEHSVQSFVNMTDSDARDGLLNDINDVLNEEVITAWRELKKWGGNLADESGDLNLELRYIEETGGFRFEFKVTDRSTTRKRVFNVVDRSKGFQWFFNFQMKLRFNPKYQQDASGAVYLLDEPGSYLHSSAQIELLRTLQQISETNTILYCTHSQHLLDPERINISQTRIVHKEDGHIRVIPFGSAGRSNYQGALTPVFDALHLRTGVFNREIKWAVITEGVTDYYFIEMLRKHRRDWDLPNVDLIPGSGAKNLKDLISMAIAFAEDYRVLLDSDREGLSARKRYEKFFGPVEAEKILLYATPEKNKNVELEDFLSIDDMHRLLEMTGAQSEKNAITQLYFSTRGKDFWSGLSDETINNLQYLRKSLLELVEQVSVTH